MQLSIRDFIQSTLPQEPWYNSIKEHIKAIILYGSVAKGTNKPDSDVDFLIIVPLEIEKKYTAGEYVYRFKNQEINIVLRSIEHLRTLASDRTNHVEAEIFRSSKIIWEKDKEVRNLLQLIKAPQTKS